MCRMLVGHCRVSMWHCTLQGKRKDCANVHKAEELAIPNDDDGGHYTASTY